MRRNSSRVLREHPSCAHNAAARPPKVTLCFQHLPIGSLACAHELLRGFGVQHERRVGYATHECVRFWIERE
jgi:hypothetical protein